MYKVLLALLFPVVMFGQKAENKRFTITAYLTGVPENSLVSVTDGNNPMDTVAKSKFVNGKVILKGTIQESNIYQLNLQALNRRLTLFLSNDEITIKGDANNLAQVKVEGSASHTDFAEFQSIFNPLYMDLAQVTRELNTRPEQQRSDSLMNIYHGQLNKIKSAIADFAARKKSSPVTAFMLVVTSEIDQDPLAMEQRYLVLEPAVQTSYYGKIVRQQIDDAKFGAIGTDAIDFTQNDTTGNPVSLASYRGKYVLIDFWASWCKPCRDENPNVVAAFDKFKAKNFTVLGVSLDRARESWLQAIHEDDLRWTQVSDLKFWNNEVAVKYRIQSIPQNFLIDPNGKIIGKNLRGTALQSKLCELLGCN